MTVPLFKVEMSPFAGPSVDAVLASGYIGQGPKVEEFEDALEPWTGHRPVSVNSGTSALMMALRLAGVGDDDVVISTPMTCSATNVAIRALGARPMWADVNPVTGLIDPESVGRLIKRWDWYRFKAIMAVDWGGQPADYDALHSFGIPVIEDAAHSFGATYYGSPVGSLADYTAFSFQAIKHLTTGDGGALVVPEDKLHRAKNMRWFGLDRETSSTFRGEQDITEWGWKFHMNDISATIGLANLERVREVLKGCWDKAQSYNERLHSAFTRTAPDYHHTGSWWMYTTLLPTEEQRDAFKLHMDAAGIQASQVHWRNDRLSIFAEMGADLPGLDAFSSRMICLPTHSATPIDQVIDTANRFFA